MEKTEMDVETVNNLDGDGKILLDNPNSNSLSDDSDTDEETGKQKLAELEKILASNPLSYDTHVEYIRRLRKLGDIKKLREAREAMNALFPLSPEMWQEWANDEFSLSTGPKAIVMVEKIYEHGVKEYLSVNLWLAYIKFVEENDQSVCACTPSGISKMRELFERALTAAGLHVVEGHKIWEAYKEYEEAILFTIDQNNIEEKTKQVQRIRSLFHRQLSIPHEELKSALNAYRTWEIEQGNTNSNNVDGLTDLPPQVITAYERAIDAYDARNSYENMVASKDASDTEKCRYYMDYLRYEESNGEPVRVQVLYERAIADCPVSTELWLGYTRYLDKTLKTSVVLRDVYSRATKSCSWVGELWSRYLLSLERANASEFEFNRVFESALQCSFSTFEEYLDLFLTRIDGLRRRICKADHIVEHGLDYHLIRETFQRAVEYLSPYLKNTESLLRLHAYWAHLELKLGKDQTAARGVWENLVKISGSMLGVWLSYIAMEIEVGCLSEARSIYRRCYSKKFAGTGSEDICISWLRFEREFGSLEDFDFAERKVTPRLEDLSIFRLQQKAQTGVASATQGNLAVKIESFQDNVSKKRRYTSTAEHLSRQHEDGIGRSKVTENKLAKGRHMRVDENVNPSGGLGNFPPLMDHKSTHSKQLTTVVSSGKPTLYTDQCTVFVSNLSSEATEGHLQSFFSDVGGIIAIRLLKDKFSGRSRGLAYIDFSDEEHLAAAVAKNRGKLLGKKISVARSDPAQSKKKVSSDGGSSRKRGQEAVSGKGRGAAMHMSNEVISKTTSQAPVSSHKRGGHVELFGRNTFAAPRSVRPLGWSAGTAKNVDTEEAPKSNDDFRKMLIKD